MRKCQSTLEATWPKISNNGSTQQARIRGTFSVNKSQRTKLNYSDVLTNKDLLKVSREFLIGPYLNRIWLGIKSCHYAENVTAPWNNSLKPIWSYFNTQKTFKEESESQNKNLAKNNFLQYQSLKLIYFWKYIFLPNICQSRSST